MVAGTQVFYRLSGSKWCFDDLYATGSALMFDNSDWNWKYGNMDSRFSENSAKCYLASLYMLRNLKIQHAMRVDQYQCCRE